MKFLNYKGGRSAEDLIIKKQNLYSSVDANISDDPLVVVLIFHYGDYIIGNGPSMRIGRFVQCRKSNRYRYDVFKA